MNDSQCRGTGRLCLREPIKEIEIAAGYLNDAVSAHIANHHGDARDLLNRANTSPLRDALREWSDSLMGESPAYVQYRPVPDSPLTLKPEERPLPKMPTAAEKRFLIQRDGHHCRFCGIPVIRKEVRERLREFYPDVMPWGDTNAEQHAAFQVMWLQYDHILPHSRGGVSDRNNMVITCAPCNYGRMSRTLEEVGLQDPRLREPVKSAWDGLERVLRHQTALTTAGIKPEPVQPSAAA